MGIVDMRRYVIVHYKNIFIGKVLYGLIQERVEKGDRLLCR